MLLIKGFNQKPRPPDKMPECDTNNLGNVVCLFVCLLAFGFRIDYFSLNTEKDMKRVNLFSLFTIEGRYSWLIISHLFIHSEVEREKTRRVLLHDIIITKVAIISTYDDLQWEKEEESSTFACCCCSIQEKQQTSSWFSEASSCKANERYQTKYCTRKLALLLLLM